jgi:hypothetical protein
MITLNTSLNSVAGLGAMIAIVAGLNLSPLTPQTAHAAEPAVVAVMVDKAQSGEFTKANFDIKGQWEIIRQDGQTIFRLSEDFRTKRGPDLKLFLSPKKVSAATGETATTNTVRLGALKSNKGTQDYILPGDIDLSNFKSILIHCEAYSKLWGGADI